MDSGDKEEIKKFMGRTVRVTKQHNEDIKELLRFGLPQIIYVIPILQDYLEFR